MKPITENIIEESAIEILLQPVYKKLNFLYSKRLDKIPFINMGEDSLRYDFFCAISDRLNLKSWELQLEYPVCEETYIPRLDPKSKRKEKPQIDLVITNQRINAAFEFGLFRRNSNPNGTINKTGKTLKMINDFIRLGMHSYYTGHESFFICVADSFMLKHQMDCKVYDPFPASKYSISQEEINKINTAVITKSFFDERFFQKRDSLSLNIHARLIHESEIRATNIEYLTKLLVWRIETQINN